MRWITLRQLKALRRLPVPPEALEAGRRRLLIVMADAPMAAGGSRLSAFIWKPAMAAFIVVVFVAVSGGGVVYAAQGSMPGDTLYSVKLVSEGFQEHLTISPERRFAVQAEHAARRLDETQQLLERSGLDEQERETRVRKAITGYEHRLTSMNKIAVRLAADPTKRVLDLVASATATGPEVAEIAPEPIDDSIRLEDDVLIFLRGERKKDGEKLDDAERGREDHGKERERLSNHLKRLRDGLRMKPLEIKAGM